MHCFFKMIMTKNELYAPEVWIEMIGKIDQNPAHGETLTVLVTYLNLAILDNSYERLIALFVGSYYVNTLDKLPKVAEEDMLKTRDNLGEYLSTLTGLSIILRI